MSSLGKRLIIDGYSIAHAFRHVHRDLTHTGKDGTVYHTGVLFGVLNLLEGLMADFDPDDILFVWEASDRVPGWRRVVYPAYKSGRANKVEQESEEEREHRRTFYREQVPMVQEVLAGFGFVNIKPPAGFEADDMVAALAGLSGELRLTEDVIVSSDKDFVQLVNRQVRVLSPFIKDLYAFLTPAQCAAGIHRGTTFLACGGWELMLLRAMEGDASDSIPGVKGIGPARARRVLINLHNRRDLSMLSGRERQVRKAFNALGHVVEVGGETLPTYFPSSPSGQERVKRELQLSLQLMGLGCGLSGLDLTYGAHAAKLQGQRLGGYPPLWESSDRVREFRFGLQVEPYMRLGKREQVGRFAVGEFLTPRVEEQAVSLPMAVMSQYGMTTFTSSWGRWKRFITELKVLDRRRGALWQSLTYMSNAIHDRVEAYHAEAARRRETIRNALSAGRG